MIDEMTGQNKENLVDSNEKQDTRKACNDVLPGLNSLCVYHSSIVPEARNRLLRGSACNSLSLSLSWVSFLNIFTRKCTYTTEYRRIPMHLAENSTTKIRRHGKTRRVAETSQIVKYFH